MRRFTERLRERCELAIGHRFRDPRLLRNALTHGSAKSDSRPSNERLEFLGDAVLGFLTSKRLYDLAETLDEGRMTKVRSQAVSRRSLRQVADDLELAELMVVGKMFKSPEEIRDSTLADAVEALLAAVYLDAGLEAADAFYDRHFRGILARALSIPGGRDFKSRFGQWVQRCFGCNPRYEVEGLEGPEHERVFAVAALIGGEVWGRARGANKKEAEQRAAAAALRRAARERPDDAELILEEIE